MGITNEGQSTEDKVKGLCPSARKLDPKLGERKKDGDLVVNCNGEDFFIEVKKDAWNQTRPQKYITHVGYNTTSGQWFVIAPDDLLKEIVERSGQHTKDPTVCVGLGKPNHAERWNKYRCDSNQLEKQIHAAIQQGERNTKMKRAARILREDHQRTTERRRSVLREAMSQ